MWKLSLKIIWKEKDGFLLIILKIGVFDMQLTVEQLLDDFSLLAKSNIEIIESDNTIFA